MTWVQLKELIDEGLVTVQSHSHTHKDLVKAQSDLTGQAYKELLQTEIVKPSKILKDKLGVENFSFAYPYGEANHEVIELVKESQIELAMTVTSGSNTAFSHPYLLNRTMVLGSYGMKKFKEILSTVNNAKL